MTSLTGKVAVITGGNSGIGLATAKLFAAEGARVVITGRRQQVVDAAVAEIGAAAIGIRGDVADVGHHRQVAEIVRERFGGADIYLNVAGGLRIAEPAADLAVAAALVSSLVGRPMPQDCVVFGELSLSGAIRPVAQAGARLREAGRLGFRRALLPASATAADCDGMAQRPLSELSGLLALFPAAPPSD